MTDPDDDAFSWEGDERRGGTARSVPVQRDPVRQAVGEEAGRSVALVAFGVLGGIALLETAFWLRSVLLPTIAASVTPGTGSPVEVLVLVLTLAGRVLAVAAPLVWFGVVAWRVPAGSRRFAWLALGAVLLVPWPAVLAAA